MNIGEITKIISACDATETVPLIEGKHGIGKSQITMQYAKANNMHCEQLILSLMDTADLLGIPTIEKVGGATSTIWAAPDWYQRIVNAAWPVTMKVSDLTFKDKEFNNFFGANFTSDTVNRAELNELYCLFVNISNDAMHLLTQDLVGYAYAKRSVLFLDEFNRAPADILNASLQLILDKRLHSHVLPVIDGKATLVVAAINPDGDDYTVSSLDPALLDRFLQLEVQVDKTEWLAYARSKKINAIITDFIIEHPDRLYFEPEEGATATPRSWEKLGKFMDIIDSIDKSHLFTLVKGLVGSEVGSQFVRFYEDYSKSMKFADIEKETKKLLKAHKNNVTEVGKILKEKLTDGLEVIKQMETASQFYEKYIDKKPKDALPLLVFLYSMPLEQAAAFIVGTKKQDRDLNKFGALDSLNKNELLIAILTSGMSEN